MPRLPILIPIAALLASAQDRGPANFYSTEKENAVGAALAVQVRSQSAITDNPDITRYVEQVGNRLIASLPDRGIQYSFTVLDRTLGGSTNEPLALPGGYVFVPVKLLLAARNEDELSGMLAHAIAHVAARHGTRQATRAGLTNLSPGPVVLVSSPADADQSVLPSGLLSLQQSFEKEADLAAPSYCSREM